MKLRFRVSVVTPILAVILLGATASAAGPRTYLPPAGARTYLPPAGARPYLPPAHELFQGVTGQPISDYQRATGKHPAVYQVFSAWGQWLPAIFSDAQAAHARLMIHITTASGSREMITPGQIARGGGDAWLIALNQQIASTHVITYVRWMAEMDAYWNPYSAFNANGSRRSADHSTAAYKAAWRRAALILRGGSRATIDAGLQALGQPPLRAGADLPAAPVAMQWVPQVAGAPNITGNQPRNYFPGRQWVDWVGTDFYSKFPNFSGLTSFYNAFPGLPFSFGEWAMWGADDPGFVDRFFRWIGAHPRVRMLIYNEGYGGEPFQLSRYPRAATRIRAWLRGARFPNYAPAS